MLQKGKSMGKHSEKEPEILTAFTDAGYPVVVAVPVTFGPPLWLMWLDFMFPGFYTGRMLTLSDRGVELWGFGKGFVPQGLDAKRTCQQVWVRRKGRKVWRLDIDGRRAWITCDWGTHLQRLIDETSTRHS